MTSKLLPLIKQKLQNTKETVYNGNIFPCFGQMYNQTPAKIFTALTQLRRPNILLQKPWQQHKQFLFHTNESS